MKNLYIKMMLSTAEKKRLIWKAPKLDLLLNGSYDSLKGTKMIGLHLYLLFEKQLSAQKTAY